jgi:small subunit ribosomal protein S16
MVVIHLAPHGRKGDKIYKVTVCPKGAKLTGRYLEQIGIYRTCRKAGQKDSLNLNVEKYSAWIAKGAQPSATLAKIIREHKVELPQAAAKKVAAPKAEKKAKPAVEAKAAKAPAKKAAAPAKKK